MSAKEMFEKLGYKYQVFDDFIGVTDNNDYDICTYDLKNKSVCVWLKDYTLFDLFKAIAKQIEELGWEE